MKQRFMELLDGYTLTQLRVLAELIAVRSPTTKSKEELIRAIARCFTGGTVYMKPYYGIEGVLSPESYESYCQALHRLIGA